MLTPSTTTWASAFPVVVVAALLLFLPGTVAGLILRLRPLAAVTLGPVLSTTCLSVAGIVAPMVHVRWGVGTLAVSVLVMWGIAWLVRSFLAKRSGPTDPDEPTSRPTADLPPSSHRGWHRLVARLDTGAWATLLGVAVAQVAVAVALVYSSGSPEAFPQAPDTIFHLGTAQWMLEHGDISSLGANAFNTTNGTGFYPAAFHGFTATIALLTGAPVVVATSAFVLVAAGLAWPLGCIALAQTLLGRRTIVVLSAAITSVAFTGFPYLLFGAGVLWPNLFGQSLLPACLAALVATLGSPASRPYVVAGRRAALALVVASLPGLTLAHPNALISFGIFAALFIIGAALGRAWQSRARPWHAAGIVGAVGLTVALIGAAATVIRPAVMVNNGKLGPEATGQRALEWTLLFAPNGAKPLPLLAAVVGIGAVALLVRHRGVRWVVSGLIVMLALLWLNLAVDNESVRYLTWPWYNVSARIQAITILPAAIAATAGLVAVADLLARPLRRLAPTDVTILQLIAGGLVILTFVGATRLYTYQHRRIVAEYFHPTQDGAWWAKPTELEALYRIGTHLPARAVVAANPWNGGTYLYIVSGRSLLIPTEKTTTAGDRKLLAKKLNQTGTDPKVCAAAQRQDVDWAITGGTPFWWAKKRNRNYPGIDSVGTSSAWQKVVTETPYTLYKRVACAE
ncbi:MAG: DUF6541 family protein [Dermatophilaceae bacterium]